jgi:hypothetical protein
MTTTSWMKLRCANVTSSIVLTIVKVAFWRHLLYLRHSEFAMRNFQSGLDELRVTSRVSGFVALLKVPILSSFRFSSPNWRTLEKQKLKNIRELVFSQDPGWEEALVQTEHKYPDPFKMLHDTSSDGILLRIARRKNLLIVLYEACSFDPTYLWNRNSACNTFLKMDLLTLWQNMSILGINIVSLCQTLFNFVWHASFKYYEMAHVKLLA